MPTLILPDTFLALLTAFAPCFHAPTSANFAVLVAGWVHCLGRRTVTAVVLAAGVGGSPHLSTFYRFFGRAQWSLDQVGYVLFTLALRWIPPEAPLLVLGDDTLARKSGKCIALGSMHHDPLRSTRTKPFFSFGHVWVVLALWVPLPMSRRRGFALPILVRLYVGAKRGGKADAPSRPGAGKRRRVADVAYPPDPRPTKLELLRELVALVAGWAGARPITLVVDSAYAARTILEARLPTVEVISRLRMDAALWTPPPPRRPGRKGRPRRKGRRLPTPAAAAACCRRWRTLTLELYGRTVSIQSFTYTALWYGALRAQPVRIVVVRDPTGERRDEAFFGTDPTMPVAVILEGYARRWTLEVTFHDSKQFLGFADPQNQTATAVRRTAPLALVVYDLVLLWYAQYAEGQTPGPFPDWPARPWYRAKSRPSFQDMLTTLRRAGWRQFFSEAPRTARWPQNSCTSWPDAVLATA
ncbi:MAG TPA: transposase [Chloroflexota bacterium]|jgi:hypothetical protein|nr:transposase [Chloroflexota bacterium]